MLSVITIYLMMLSRLHRQTFFHLSVISLIYYIQLEIQMISTTLVIVVYVLLGNCYKINSELGYHGWSVLYVIECPFKILSASLLNNFLILYQCMHLI